MGDDWLYKKPARYLLTFFDTAINRFDYTDLPFGGPSHCIRKDGAGACHKRRHCAGLFIANRTPAVAYARELAHRDTAIAWDERVVNAQLTNKVNPWFVDNSHIENVRDAVRGVDRFFEELEALYAERMR